MQPGDKIILNGKLYANSQTHCGIDRSGEWYLYDDKVINNRYRVTNLLRRVGKMPLAANVSGYVNLSDIVTK